MKTIVCVLCLLRDPWIYKSFHSFYCARSTSFLSSAGICVKIPTAGGSIATLTEFWGLVLVVENWILCFNEGPPQIVKKAAAAAAVQPGGKCLKR